MSRSLTSIILSYNTKHGKTTIFTTTFHLHSFSTISLLLAINSQTTEHHLPMPCEDSDHTAWANDDEDDRARDVSRLKPCQWLPCCHRYCRPRSSCCDWLLPYWWWCWWKRLVMCRKWAVKC